MPWLTLTWLVIQIVGYSLAMAALVIGSAIVALAPPYWAGRYLWQRCR